MTSPAPRPSEIAGELFGTEKASEAIPVEFVATDSQGGDVAVGSEEGELRERH
jgi:hypothetical protein